MKQFYLHIYLPVYIIKMDREMKTRNWIALQFIDRNLRYHLWPRAWNICNRWKRFTSHWLFSSSSHRSFSISLLLPFIRRYVLSSLSLTTISPSLLSDLLFSLVSFSACSQLSSVSCKTLYSSRISSCLPLFSSTTTRSFFTKRVILFGGSEMIFLPRSTYSIWEKRYGHQSFYRNRIEA